MMNAYSRDEEPNFIMSSLSSASSSEIAGNPSRNTPSVIAFDDEFTTTGTVQIIFDELTEIVR